MSETYFNIEIHSIHFSVQFISRWAQIVCCVDIEDETIQGSWDPLAKILQ